MNFNGIWKDDLTGKLIKLSKLDDTDYYRVEYGDNFEDTEEILFCIGQQGSDLVHISESKFFTSKSLIILSPNSFAINNIVFKRQHDN
jgi:hypothetical protein